MGITSTYGNHNYIKISNCNFVKLLEDLEELTVINGKIEIGETEY